MFIASGIRAAPPPRRRFTRRRAALFSLAFVGCLLSHIFQAPRAGAATLADLSPSRDYRVESVVVDGAHAVSADDVLAVMQTRPCPAYQIWKRRPEFDPETFRGDLDRIRRLYHSRGYYEVRVRYDLRVNGRDVTPKIEIREGRAVKVADIDVAVTPAGAPVPARLDAKFRLDLRRGEIFDQAKYQAAARQLTQLYLSRGYPWVRVRRHAQVFVADGEARVRYEINPGVKAVFGRTTVSGTNAVAPAIILRELDYRRGETFDSRKIAASRARIVALNLFGSIAFEPERDPANPGVVPIEIKVTDQRTRMISGAIGYNTETLFNAGVDWQDYNFFGGARRAYFAALYSSVVSTLDARVTQPWFPTRNTNLVLEARQDQEVYQTYTLYATRFVPRLTWSPSPSLTAFAGWRLEYMKFNSVAPSTIAAIGGYRGQGILSGPNAGLVYNNTEDPLNPQHGMIFTLLGNVALHQFGSNYQYWRASAELRRYHRIGWNTVLATRLKLGFENTLGAIGDIPLSERFYSGGEGSVRGYGLRRIGPLSAANDPLGGLSLYETSVELRHQVTEKFIGSIFLDCGQVSTQPYDLRVDAPQCGYGPGVSLVTPVGPATVDIGFPTQKPRGDSFWQVYFSIGQYF
jgi:outer membrane protein assembly complex protein YaeT